MKHHQNIILLIVVVLLTVFPLWLVQKPAPAADGKEVAIFSGADDKARDLIGEINPNFTRWLEPFFEPPSGEISSLLFALQAALGAGFIGYYLGVSLTRENMRRQEEKQTETHAEMRTGAD